MKKIISILLLLCVLTLPALAATIPEPTDVFYAADYANVLSQNTIDYIVSQNDALCAKTGAQIVIATVDFLGGEDIENYAYQMFNDWGIGSAEKNNGVLILLAIGEENYWAVQGKGLESSLSSNRLGDLLYNYLEEDFAAGDYDAGVRKVFDAVYSELESIYGSVPQTNQQNQGSTNEYYQNNSQGDYDDGVYYGGFWGFFNAIPIFIVIVVLILVFTSPFRRIGRGYYGGRPIFRPFGWFLWGNSHRHHHHGPPPGFGPPPGGNDNPFDPGPRKGGGGSSRGGGAGRGGFGGFGGGGFGGGGFGGFKGGGGGGFRGGGGGGSRGGGAGRR